MFPETLVTLIWTLEKSWSCCAEATRLNNIGIMVRAIIIKRRSIRFILSPSVERRKLYHRLRIPTQVTTAEESEARAMLPQPIGRGTQRGPRRGRCSPRGPLRFWSADVAGRSGAFLP